MEWSRSCGFAYVFPFSCSRFTIIVLGVLGEEKRYTFLYSMDCLERPQATPFGVRRREVQPRECSCAYKMSLPYTKVKPLGSGAFGKVFLVRTDQANRLC